MLCRRRSLAGWDRCAQAGCRCGRTGFASFVSSASFAGIDRRRRTLATGGTAVRPVTSSLEGRAHGPLGIARTRSAQRMQTHQQLERVQKLLEDGDWVSVIGCSRREVCSTHIPWDVVRPAARVRRTTACQHQRMHARGAGGCALLRGVSLSVSTAVLTDQDDERIHGGDDECCPGGCVSVNGVNKRAGDLHFCVSFGTRRLGSARAIS